MQNWMIKSQQQNYSYQVELIYLKGHSQNRIRSPSYHLQPTPDGFLTVQVCFDWDTEKKQDNWPQTAQRCQTGLQFSPTPYKESRCGLSPWKHNFVSHTKLKTSSQQATHIKDHLQLPVWDHAVVCHREYITLLATQNSNVHTRDTHQTSSPALNCFFLPTQYYHYYKEVDLCFQL